MALFKEYKNHPDESVRERANNWAIAIGLQRVDGLNVSDFLFQVARQEIEGKITMDEALIAASHSRWINNGSMAKCQGTFTAELADAILRRKFLAE